MGIGFILIFVGNLFDMEKWNNLDFRYADHLLKIRDVSFCQEEYFNKLILEIRIKLYDYIISNNDKRYIAYVISMEIATIIDYLYCKSEDMDTYPCERIIQRYGYTIEYLLDDEIFQYVFG